MNCERFIIGSNAIFSMLWTEDNPVYARQLANSWGPGFNILFCMPISWHYYMVRLYLSSKQLLVQGYHFLFLFRSFLIGNIATVASSLADMGVDFSISMKSPSCIVFMGLLIWYYFLYCNILNFLHYRILKY